MLRGMRSIVAGVVLFAVACSTTAPPPAVPTRESVGAFIALSVADMDRVLPFYRDTLGFRVHSEGTAPNRPIRFALLQRGNALIELVQLPDAKPRAEGTQPVQTHGFFKSGFVVDDIDEEYARLKGLNVTLAYDLGQPPGGPYRSFGVRDPEGNLLQYFGK